VQPGGNSTISVSPLQSFSGDNDTKVNSELELLGSRYLRLKIIRDMTLMSNPDFWGGKPPKGDLSEPRMRDMAIARMAKILVVTHNPRSEIIRISCTTRSPQLSARIVNTLVNEYIGYTFQLRYGSTDRVSKWLVSQLDDLKNQVESDQVQLVNLQNKLGVLGLDQKGGSYLLADSLSGLTKAEGEATVNRITAEARYRYLQDSDPNLIENEQQLLGSGQGAQNSLLQTLRSSQSQAQADYSQLTARYGANYPDVKVSKARLDALTREIKLEEQRILNQAKVSYSAALTDEQMTSKALDIRKADAFRSRDDMVRYLILQREYESHRTLYESLIQHLRVAGINAGLESAQVDVIDIADIPSIARRPLPYQLAILAFLALMIIGAIVALVVDYFDDVLNSVEDVEKFTGLSPLAILATFVKTPGEPLFSELSLAHSAYAEGMQLLRGSLLLSSSTTPRAILITSGIPREGKSTVARNLAAMFAKYGTRTLLIDGDIRKPTVYSALNLLKSPGLTDVLTSDNITIEQVCNTLPETPNLFIVTSGRSVVQPATLLGSARMGAFMEQAKAKFDLVILDMPPVLSVSEPVLCSSMVDFTVLVVRQHMISGRQEKAAVDLLVRGGANVAGFVLNGTSERWGRYGDYYSNYGQYGVAAAEETSR
jgi:capsular exopolysaccharide synthesis family protein